MRYTFTLSPLSNICFTYIIYLCALHNKPLTPTTSYKYGIKVMNLAKEKKNIYIYIYKSYPKVCQ